MMGDWQVRLGRGFRGGWHGPGAWAGHGAGAWFGHHGPWQGHGYGHAFEFTRRIDREAALRHLEEYQRDLEEEVADVADLIRRLKAEPPGPDGPDVAQA
jgi:hypothetical protein